MQKSWTPSDAALLRQLREQAGYDRAAFAQRNTLSIKQLIELEDGGTGRFYTPEIKAHTGRTLLRKLGYIAPPAEPEPEPETLPEVVARAAAPEPPAPSAPPTAPPSLFTARAPAPAAHVVLPTPAGNASPARARPGALRPVLLGTCLLLVGGGLFFLLDGAPAAAPAAPTAFAKAPAQEPPATASPSVAALPVVATAAQLPEVAPGPMATAMAAPAIAAVSKASGPCDAAARDGAAQYRSPSATRPGTYVYVQSVRGGSLCVIDGQNKQTVTALKPGESVTVSGVPPFLIHTGQWNDLRVFFQGLRVNLDTVPPPETVVLNVF